MPSAPVCHVILALVKAELKSEPQVLNYSIGELKVTGISYCLERAP